MGDVRTPYHRGKASRPSFSLQVLGTQQPAGSLLGLLGSAATPGAQRLDERAGFRVWGTEPAGARYDGQTVVDYHMALCLEPEAG